MKGRTGAIYLVMCTLVITAAVVCADLKKGYYTPARLGSLQQAATGDLSPESIY
jgi:hypothetical protein